MTTLKRLILTASVTAAAANMAACQTADNAALLLGVTTMAVLLW